MMLPEFPKRLWILRNPDTFEFVMALVSHTAEDACFQAAHRLGWDCSRFVISGSAGARQIELDGEAVTLYAAGVPDHVNPEEFAKLDVDRLETLESEGIYYVARAG